MPVLTVEQFWDKFDRSGGPDSCWPWCGARNSEGYGITRVGPALVRTHVLAFETHHRRTVQAPVVRHTCDNPPCGNPAHLVEGTHGENLSDQYYRNRRRKRTGRKGARP